MYFRFSQTAANFFRIAKQVQDNWQQIQGQLKNCHETRPSTDLLYAITAQIVGKENCTLPSMDFINFVHMKPDINRIPESSNFKDVFTTVFDDGMIRINNINQYHPLNFSYVQQKLFVMFGQLYVNSIKKEHVQLLHSILF